MKQPVRSGGNGDKVASKYQHKAAGAVRTSINTSSHNAPKMASGVARRRLAGTESGDELRHTRAMKPRWTTRLSKRLRELYKESSREGRVSTGE